MYFSWVERTISQGHILEKPPSVAVDDHEKCVLLPCRLALQLLVPSSGHITDHALGVPCVCSPGTQAPDADLLQSSR